MRKKNQIKTKILSLALAAAMLFSMAEGTTLKTEAADKSVDVFVTAQEANAFLAAPQKIKVSADLAESYGYTDNVKDGVSALDVLVAEHETVFGEAFTKDGKDDYLAVASSGWITTAFCQPATTFSFAVDEACPHDDVYGTYGYTGYTINQAAVKDGGKVEFFFYQDTSYYSDSYVTPVNGTNQVAVAGKAFDVELKGYSYAYMSCESEEKIQAATKPIEDAQLAMVNVETGEITDLDGKVTDENGKVSLDMNQVGTYLLTAYVSEEKVTDDYATPIFMPIVNVHVIDGDIAKSNVSGVGSTYTYTGKAITPTPVVTVDGETLKSGKDYDISYSSNTEAGTAKLVITGKGNFAGSKTISYKITPVSANKVSVSKPKTTTYTGYKKTPAVTVEFAGKTLKKGTDYTVTYKNNVKVGTAKVVITGKGNYTGSKTVSFKIKKRTQYAKGIYEVKTTAVKGRKGPGPTKNVNAYFKKGEKVEVLKVGKKQGKYAWLKVKKNGKTSYVYAKYLKL